MKITRLRPWVLITFSCICIIGIIYYSYEVILWKKHVKENNEIQKKIEEKITISTEDNSYQIDFKALKEMNPDTVAYIKVNHTKIDRIVVKGNDNKYYLNHNFEKNWNHAGWVFADYRNHLDGSDKNIIIYGHNVKDGSMFDTTVKVRLTDSNGCYYVETEDQSIRSCASDTYTFSAGTEVNFRADPEEGYHLLGWYEYSEVSDGEGGMTYPLDDEPIEISNNFIFTAEEDQVLNIAPVFAEGTEIPTIEFDGDLELEKLQEGPLPGLSVGSLTAHVTVAGVEWAYLPNGSREWVDFGDEEPVAEANGDFYAAKIKLNVENGYIIKPTATVIYNEMDMWDTFTEIIVDGTDFYVYVDFAQVAGESGPSVDGDVIHRSEFNVRIPKIGDIIDEDYQYSVGVYEEDTDYYAIDHDAIYIYDSETEQRFEGELEEGKTYQLIFWVDALDEYTFADNLQIIVNGESLDDPEYHYLESETRLGVAVEFTPEPLDVTYTVESEDGEYVAIFNFPEGTDFELSVIDILKYSPEEIEAMFDVPAEYIEDVVKTIKENVKEYGELISLYAIEINGPGFNFSGNGEDSITFRIRLTEEMEGYDTFKFLFLDENNEFVIEEVHDTDIVTIDGVKYIEVSLNHLSAYALVGSNTATNESGNPGTGDNIVWNGLMLGLSILGLTAAAIYTKKKYYFKTVKQDE